jgi:hypothetical protein
MNEMRTGSLDVSDDASGLVVHELDANLGDTTTGACESKVLAPSSFPNIFLFRSAGQAAQGREGFLNRTGSAKDTSDLDELDRLLGRGVHDCDLYGIGMSRFRDRGVVVRLS